MPSGLGWDTLVLDEPGSHRHRHGGLRSPFPGAPFMLGGPRDPLSGKFAFNCALIFFSHKKAKGINFKSGIKLILLVSSLRFQELL